MSFAESGLNAAVDGVTALGTHLAPCTGDPGTTGANIDTEVTPLAASWPVAADGSATSVQVTWTIPSGGGPRTYSHFAVVTDPAGGIPEFVCGGGFDTDEQFSDNGGDLHFTGTVTAEPATTA